MLAAIGHATALLLSIQTADALSTLTILQNATSGRPSISTSSSTIGVGDFIASGLGLQQGSSTAASDSSTAAPHSSTVAPVSSSNNTFLLSSNATTASPMPSSAGTSGNGSIAASALSCVASQSSYQFAVNSFESSHMSTYLTTFISTMTYQKLLFRESQTAYITLCDGLPRGLGVPTPLGNSITVTSTFNTTYTTSTLSASPTFSPPTCSIDPSDCALLLSSWSTAEVELETVAGLGLNPMPTCTTTAPPVVSSNTPLGLSSTASFTEINGICQGQCMIMGKVHSDDSEAPTAGLRLLYWPVTRVGNVCNGTSAITGTATGDGPNTYADPDIIGSLTITSPSVAISFGRLSRLDGCGTTLSNYITILDPQSLVSQRGARALQQFESFDFADLNTKCISSANVTGCYTDVPSAAYFGQNKCGGFDENFCPQTIYNDYAPQLLIPPMTTNIPPSWGNSSCVGYPDGGWDPPIALSSAGALVAPKPTPAETTTGGTNPTAQPESKPTSTPSKTGGGGGGGDPKTTSSAGDDGGLAGATTSAVGQGTSKSKAAADPTSGSRSGSNDGGSDPGTGQSGGSGSSGSGSSGSGSSGSGSSGSGSSGSGSSGSGSSESDPSVNGGSGSNASGSSAGSSAAESGSGSSGSNSNSGGSDSGGSSDPTTVGILGGASVSVDPSNSNNAAIGGTIFTPGQQTTINNVPVSIGSSGEVVAGTSTIQGAAGGNPALSATPIGTVGGSPISVDPGTTGAVIVGGHTLQNGQSTNIDNTPLAVSSGNVVIGGGSGNAPASTIAIPTSSSSDTIGGQPIVVSSGVIVIGSSTLTAGQQTTIDGTIVSAGSTQLVVGSSTIPIAPTSLATTIGGQSVVITSGHVVVGSSTLSAGQEITLDGTIVSAGSTQVVLGSSTIPIAPTDPTSTDTGAQFTGAATSAKSMHFGLTGAFVVAWFAFNVL